jgi:hypothetical protein
MQGNGLSMDVGNPKKNEDLPAERQIKIWIFGHGFPAQNILKENSAVKENVWLVPMRIFGLFLLQQTNQI